MHTHNGYGDKTSNQMHKGQIRLDKSLQDVKLIKTRTRITATNMKPQNHT
jgi:ribosomal 50S subunit-recycling heat shock protein